MGWMRIVLSAALAVLTATSAAHAEIRIGAAGPLTGTMAWFGEQHERGVAMGVAELNEAGGLLGQPIEVVSVAAGYWAGIAEEWWSTISHSPSRLTRVKL
jgi:ABC-type branched-subunit amino acid transport system substrate-binding protein